MKKSYLSICLLVPFANALAQNSDSAKISNIQEVVIQSQSLFPNKKIDEQSSSHIHIYKKELEKYNYSDVNRVIMGKPGIHVMEEDGFGMRPNIIIRGAASSRSSSINLMEDGILVAPAPYVAPAAYYFPNIGRMAGVEILKGSGQIQYGPNTVGGTFNMISTQVPKKFSGMIDANYGSFDTRKVHAYAGDKIGKFGFLVEYFTNNSDGFKNLPNKQNTGFRLQDGMVKLLYDNSTGATPSKLQFKFQLSNEDSNETYMGLTKQDYNSGNVYQRYLASELDNLKTNHRQYILSYEIKPLRNLNLNIDAYRNEFARNWYKVNDVRAGGQKTGLSAALNKENSSNEVMALKGLYAGDNSIYLRNNNRTYVSQGLQFGANYKIFDKGTLRFGSRYHNDSQDRYQEDNEFQSTSQGLILKKKGAPASQDNRIEEASATASYLQYQHEIGKWIITPGVRYENISLSQKNYGRNDPDRKGDQLKEVSNKVEVWIPGVSVMYNAMEGLSIFAGAHKGFSPPGVKEGQKPETSWNYELGSTYHGEFLDAELIGYINDYSNMLGADTNAVGGNAAQGDLFNAGKVTVKGIESQLTYTINGKSSAVRFPISATYTYFTSKFKEDFKSDIFGSEIKKGFELPYVPNHQFNIEAGAHIHKFFLSAVYKYRGEFRNQPGAGPIAENMLIPAMNIVDASVSYQLSKNSTIYSTAQNILNEKYLASLIPAGYRPGMPRFLSLGYRFKF